MSCGRGLLTCTLWCRWSLARLLPLRVRKRTNETALRSSPAKIGGGSSGYVRPPSPRSLPSSLGVSFGVSRARSSIASLFGIVLAFLALAGQLVSVSVATPDPLQKAQLDSEDVHCHSDATPPAKTPKRHSACVLCPLCLSLTVPSPVLSSPPVLPLRPLVFIARAAPPPPATGPPFHRTPISALPRGPPALI